MLHAGLDLSRKRLDVCLLSDQGELVDELEAPPDAAGLAALAQRVSEHGEPVCAVIESMTGPASSTTPSSPSAGRWRSPTPRR